MTYVCEACSSSLKVSKNNTLVCNCNPHYYEGAYYECSGTLVYIGSTHVGIFIFNKDIKILAEREENQLLFKAYLISDLNSKNTYLTHNEIELFKEFSNLTLHDLIIKTIKLKKYALFK